MWVELICGLILFGVLKWFFSDDTDADDLLHLHVETLSSRATVLFTVADRLKNLYGGKVFVGLNIPDTDSATRQNIDMVLVTDKEAVVVSVHDVSGLVSIDEKDGSWVCTTSIDNHKHHKSEEQRLPDPIEQTKRQVSILQSYLEQRGLELPEGYISFKVICPNPNLRFIGSSSFTSEVITYDQWSQLKAESKSMLSGWIKGALRVGKKESQESWHVKVNQILTTAPTWDRLELKGNKQLLGEFVEFKGKHDDVQELRHVKRSKVGRLMIQKTSMFGLAPPSKLQLLYAPRDYFVLCLFYYLAERFPLNATPSELQVLYAPRDYFALSRYYFLAERFPHNAAPSKLQVLYAPRDYRGEAVSASDWKEVTVKASTEVIFQPKDSDKVRKYKLASVTSLTLSA